LLLLGLEYHVFFFLVSFVFFWLGASVLPLGYCVVAEAECNWYLSILIYSLYKKIPVIKSIATIFTILFLRTPCDCFWFVRFTSASRSLPSVASENQAIKSGGFFSAAARPPLSRKAPTYLHMTSYRRCSDYHR
jgi:hypothetical protein